MICIKFFFQRVMAWGVLVIFQTTLIKDLFCKILKEAGAKVTSGKSDNFKDLFVSVYKSYQAVNI